MYLEEKWDTHGPKWLLSLCQATCAAFNCHTRKLETLPSAGFASDRRTGVMCVGETQKQFMSSVDLGPSNFLPPGHSNELSAECHIWPVMHRHQNTEQNIAKEPQFCIFPIKIGLEEAVQLEFKGRSYCPKFCIMHHNWAHYVSNENHILRVRDIDVCQVKKPLGIRGTKKITCFFLCYNFC